MQIIKQAFYAEPFNDRWDDEEVFKHYISDIMDNKNSLALGMFDGDNLIALALGRLKHWFYGIEYCIDDLCVKNEFQGRGAGSELIKLIRSYAAENGFVKISLKTDRRAPAYHFYKKNGFCENVNEVYYEMKIR